MSLLLRFSPEVPNDLQDACQWYEDRRTGLGVEFINEVHATLLRIEENPELFAASYRDVRSARLHRFPYIVHYRLLNNTVLVLAVMHGRRDPGIWQTRVSRDD